MVKVIINGCNGKMGQMLSEIIAPMEDVTIVAGVDVEDKGLHSYPFFTSIEACTAEADAVIDFTIAAVTDDVVAACTEKKLPLVLGTTGLSGEQLEHVRQASQQIPIVQSYNMSLGINTLVKLLRAAAPVLAEAGFDIELVEKHHNQKIDAPSGTALLLADTKIRRAAMGINISMIAPLSVRRGEKIRSESVPCAAEPLWESMR